jgi:hypothetical protein
MTRARITAIFIGLVIACMASRQSIWAQSTTDSRVENGIHVGAPKIYDSRELTLMLESLSRSLRNASFVDPKALASALGNFQGFNNQDFSQSFMANGAVGPQAAAVFAGPGAAAATPPAGATTATSPSVSITLAPVLNSGAAAAAPAASAASATIGPQPPALPTLQTAPSFTPNYGLTPDELLSNEVNLTYQVDNIQMLLERSLTDRIFKDKPRLQAVMEFDIDIEPTVEAKDAVAVVDVTVTLADCKGLPSCDVTEHVSLVAMMPEEGSHNAATLNQKADAFGGAVAASVFSVGYQAQNRSQVFYLYRDMDTLSFQNASPMSPSVNFGWQFRPVLGRRTVSAGRRHMMTVLALPANDMRDDAGRAPELKVAVRTSWKHYDGAVQATLTKQSFWATLFGGGKLPGDDSYLYSNVLVPVTATTQKDLSPTISSVKWVQGDALNGVALVEGENFFPDTTIRFGARTFSSPADGLVIKSDHQLEVALPVTAALTEGVLSGRYGKSRPLEARDSALPSRIEIRRLEFSAAGNDLYQVDATLGFFDDASDYTAIRISDLQARANRPLISVNGIPIAAPPFMSQDSPSSIRLTTFVPSALIKSGPSMVSVTFPFAGPGWTASLPHYDGSIKVIRLSGTQSTRLLISSTDSTMLLCGYHPGNPNASHIEQTWTLQLDGGKPLPLSNGDDANPPSARLHCVSQQAEMLGLDIPTKELKQYHRFALVNKEGVFHVMVGDIPPQDPPPPGPELDKDQKIAVAQYDVKSVSYKGKNLGQVNKVVFDKTGLDFKSSDDGKTIVISLGSAVTAKPRNVELQLISDGNDPVLAPLTVNATPIPKGGK